MVITVQQSSWGLAMCALRSPEDGSALRVEVSGLVNTNELDASLRSEFVGYVIDGTTALISGAWLRAQLYPDPAADSIFSATLGGDEQASIVR